MIRQRIEWIDIAKGIGILLVAGSHIFGGWVTKYSEWFYMPLFFFLSGYLYDRPAEGVSFVSFVGKKIRHLLLPYATFLFLLAILVYVSYLLLVTPANASPRLLLEFVGRLIYGGQALGGVFGYLGRSYGVFWFMTCLFLTQILYNVVQQLSRGNRTVVFLVVATMYILAMLDSHFRFLAGAFKGWGLPWALNVVALAMVYFYVGHTVAEAGRSQRYAAREYVYGTLALVASIFFVMLAVLLDNSNVLPPGLTGMKFARYGVPVYSTLLSLACICLVVRLSQVIASSTDLLKQGLMECGQASMVIMFVHSFIQFTMNDYPATQNSFLRMAVSVLLSYCLYRLFLLSRSTRRIFLGTSW